MVVYNADFDRRLLSQTNALYGLPDFDADWHCSMRQFAAYTGIWHERYETWRWHKLMTALGMVGGQFPAIRHRALQDTEASRQIVRAMADGVVPDTSSGERAPTVISSSSRGHEEPDEPIRGEVIGPGDEERFGDDPRGWETRSGTFAGGQYTVISTRTKGCSPGLLVAILIGGIIAIIVGCCAFFYLFAQFLSV